MAHFQLLKPLTGFKAQDHTTPAGEIIQLDPDSPEAKLLLQHGVIAPAKVTPAAAPAADAPADVPSDMTSTDETTDLDAPKPSKKSKGKA